MITLATLHEATEQQIFDQVAAHLLKQQAKSMISLTMCAYRGRQGMMCAAGCLIADDEYDAEMDQHATSWNSLVDRKLVPAAHKNFIRGLQSVHDGLTADVAPGLDGIPSVSKAQIINSLSAFAKRCGLKFVAPVEGEA